MTKFKVEPHSQTWLAVKAEAEKSITSAQRRLAQRGLDPIATEYERGGIAALQAILKMAEPRPEIPDTLEADPGY